MHIKKKLLKNFFIQNILGFFTFLYITAVKLTSSIQFENESIPQQFWDDDKPFILAFWHSQLMMIGCSWKKNNNVNILASGHSDGRFGAIVGKYFNLKFFEDQNPIGIIGTFDVFAIFIMPSETISFGPLGPSGVMPI